MIKGEPTYTPCDSTLADGLAVSMVGVNSFATARPLVDKSVQVSEEYIAIAILRLLELEKAVVEGNAFEKMHLINQTKILNLKT
jgi:threonine dehydratase